MIRAQRSFGHAHYAHFAPSTKSIVLGIIGVTGLLLAVIANKLIFTDIGFFSEGPPRLTADYLWRSLLIAASTSCICYAVVFWRSNAPAGSSHAPPAVGKLYTIASAFVLAALFLATLIVKPALFSEMSLEDGVIEWTSALFLFASAAALLWAFLKLRKTGNSIAAATLLFIATVFFVIGMEEVSWFQRVIGLKTSAAFESNIQGEMNLHNFATDLIENIYYLSAFAFTVFLPFMRSRGIFPINIPYFNLVIPRPYILYVGAIACAYNFDMWNIVLTQITFFGTCFILLVQMASPSKINTTLAALTLAMVVLTQSTFLYFDEHHARAWVVTEYKEFFIPLASLVYAVDVLFRTDKKAATGSQENHP